MKSAGAHDQPNYPPPAYSPPGQNAPGQTKASAPPPPGLHGGSPLGHHDQSAQPPIIIYNTTTQSIQFGPYPMRVNCPHCHAHVMTETNSTPGLLTYILSGALCILAGYLLCCLVPCCVRECKDIEHRCPSCQSRLGLFKRI